MTHSIPRSSLPENGVLSFYHGGASFVVVDVAGEVRAFLVTGPAAQDLDRFLVADGALLCPRHGWTIDIEAGQCGAAEACRYRRVPVELGEDTIRVQTP